MASTPAGCDRCTSGPAGSSSFWNESFDRLDAYVQNLKQARKEKLMSATERGAPAQSATADREIVISRIIDAPRELVFEAFTEVRHLSQWWGPNGFTTTTRAFEFRVGGEWTFVMHGPDGTDYQEWISWTEITPPERIALLHGEVPRRSERLRVGPHVRARRRSDPDRDAHGVPHQGDCATRRSRSTTRSRAASRP